MEKYLIKIDEFSIKAENNICFIDFFAHSSKNALSLLVASLMKDILFVDKKTQKTIFNKFLQDEKIVLIVMRSLVKDIFCSGGHLKDFLSAEEQDYSIYGESVRMFCKTISEHNIPSIAILNGNAYGGGVELALAPQFRWSIGKSVDFYFTQTKFGVPGGWGGMTRLQELCPCFSSNRISSLFLSQDVFKFDRLMQLSLIDKVFVDENSCRLEVLKWRNSIISCDEQVKEDFFKRNTININQLEDYDKNFFEKYFLTEKHKKNINNFLDKKKIK